MTVNPVPTITVGGAAVPITAGADLVAIDELRLTWGRKTVLDRVTPARVSLRLRDTSPTATFAARPDLMGQPVVLGWTGGGAGVSFRGRITDVAVHRRSRGGFTVDLAASSKEVEAANYRAPRGSTWPAETFSARLARIVALLPAGFFASGVSLPSRAGLGLPPAATEFANATAAPADASNTDALTLLRQLWDSTYPVPLIYDPQLDKMGYVLRRKMPPRGVTGFWTAALKPSADYGGRYIVYPADSSGAPVDGHDIDFDGDLTQNLENRYTRVEVGFFDAAAATPYTAATTVSTTAVAGAEASTGRRTLPIDSVHASATAAAELAAFWTDLCDAEAARPTLAPLTYSGKRNGGFASINLAGLLLSGNEAPTTLFIRNTWLPRLRYRPLFGIVGGTVRYTAGHWSVTFTPAPLAVDNSPLKVSNAGLPAVRLADIDPTVTFGDLRYVDIGAGFTSATQPT